MNIASMPPGAENRLKFEECIEDVGGAASRLRGELPQINDPWLRPRVAAFLEATTKTIEEHRDEPGPTVADRLNDLLNGVKDLEVPARDPDLGPTPTLEKVEQATGLIAIRLMKALDAASALGWVPKKSELPEGLTASVARQEVGGLLDHIADRLSAVAVSLDLLVEASNAREGFPQEKDLVTYFAGSTRVEIDLAKMHLNVNTKRVDFVALWRAIETIAELTLDFTTTVRAWAQRVSVSVRQAAEMVRRRVRMMVSGVSRVFRFVARRRQRAERSAQWDPDQILQDERSRDSESLTQVAQPADFDLNAVHEMILVGVAPPEEWRPFIVALNFDRTNITNLAPLSGLTDLQSLNLSRTAVHDLSALGRLTNLQTLYLTRTPIADLSPLAGLTRLSRIDLWRTPVEDLSPLAHLINLRSLDLEGTRVRDLSALASLVGLERLDLKGTPVNDLRPLAGLINLRQLNLTNTRVRDLSALAGLTQLRGLRLAGTPVRDASPLAGLVNLRQLELWGTQIREASFLGKFENLQHVGLDARTRGRSSLPNVRKLTIV